MIFDHWDATSKHGRARCSERANISGSKRPQMSAKQLESYGPRAHQRAMKLVVSHNSPSALVTTNLHFTTLFLIPRFIYLVEPLLFFTVSASSSQQLGVCTHSVDGLRLSLRFALRRALKAFDMFEPWSRFGHEGSSADLPGKNLPEKSCSSSGTVVDP